MSVAIPSFNNISVKSLRLLKNGHYNLNIVNRTSSAALRTVHNTKVEKILILSQLSALNYIPVYT